MLTFKVGLSFSTITESCHSVSCTVRAPRSSCINVGYTKGNYQAQLSPIKVMTNVLIDGTGGEQIGLGYSLGLIYGH